MGTRTGMKNSSVGWLVLLLLTSSLLISCIPGRPTVHSEEKTIPAVQEQQSQDLPPRTGNSIAGHQLDSSRENQAPQESSSSPQRSSQPLTLPSSATPTVEEYRPPLYATVLYNQDQVIFEHYWPNTASLKGDESEILVYNEGVVPVQITSSNQIFILGNQPYSQYSGTWEKFPSRQSWNRIDYVNINPNYYTGQPLLLEPGQKGKLHWHYQFKGDLSTEQQAAEIAITFTRQGKSYSLDRKLVREGSLPYLAPKSTASAEHQEEEPNEEQGKEQPAGH